MSEIQLPLAQEAIEAHNAGHLAHVREDYEALGRTLGRRGFNIDTIKKRVSGFSVAVPSWGVGVGGTRFARFPIPGEPTNIHEKLADCAVVQQLCRITPRVSLHLPWDHTDDPAGLCEEATDLGDECSRVCDLFYLTARKRGWKALNG